MGNMRIAGISAYRVELPLHEGSYNGPAAIRSLFLIPPWWRSTRMRE
jgi:hypothetical protein